MVIGAEDREYRENTSNFYIDGSPNKFDQFKIPVDFVVTDKEIVKEFNEVIERGFVSREKPGQIHWPGFNEEINANTFRSNDTKVTALRSGLWLYAEQRTTLGELRKFFSETGIALLEKDGYIKF